MAESQTDSSEIMKEQSESVAATNLKVVAEGPSFYTNMGYSNATSHQQAMNQIQLAIVSKATESILASSPSEAAGEIGALMQLIKAAQTTPPVTP